MRTLTHQPTQETTQSKSMAKGNQGRSRTISPLSTGMPMLQRQCACGGGCPRCLESSLQTKLKISEPSDKYEQEADRIAEYVVRIPASQIEQPSKEVLDIQPNNSTLKRKCSKCMEEEKPILRKAENHASIVKNAPPIIDEVVNSGGQSLDTTTQEFMESRFGYDFSDVRVHTDAKAVESARTINALAYTVRNNIVFAAEQYKPETKDGKQLLAHELTHVLQQQSETLKTKPLLQKAEGDISNNIARDSKYNVEDAIASLEFALFLAESALSDSSFSATKQAKIESQMIKLQPLVEQLENAKGTNGQGIVFGFDPDPKENEINPGDAERSIEELYADLPFPSSDQAITESETQNQSDVIQAKTLPGGLQVTPLKLPSVQRVAPIVVPIIIILGGLLASGCKKEEKKESPPDSSASSPPTGPTPSASASKNTPPPPPPPSVVPPTSAPPQPFACPTGYKDLGQFTITIYILAQEKDFPQTPKVKDPCGLKGEFSNDFLFQTKDCPRGVKTQGSGLSLSGKFIHYKGNDCFEEVPCPITKSQKCATSGRTVAVHKPKESGKTQPGEIKLGHELFIEDFGSRVAEDTGGNITEGRIDIYFGTDKNCAEAEKFGRQKKKVCRKLIK